MTVIDKCGLCRNPFGSPDGRNLAIHLGLNVAANLMLAFDLNEPQGTPRLKHKIHLHTGLPALAFGRMSAIGAGCGHQGAIQME